MRIKDQGLVFDVLNDLFLKALHSRIVVGLDLGAGLTLFLAHLWALR